MKARATRKSSISDATPIIADLDTPAVQRVVESADIGQCWQFLRKARGACSVEQIATERRLSTAVVQRAVDTLVDAGFVERLKAGSGTRSITYRAPDREVLIGWDPTSEDHKRILRRQQEAMRATSRRSIDMAPTGQRRRSGQALYLNFAATKTDFRRIMDAVSALAEQMEAANARVEALSQAATRPEGQTPPAETEEVRHLHLALELWEVAPSDAPYVPSYVIFNREELPRLAADIALAPEKLLSPKELEVAKRLSSGESRAEIASALGLSTNTILSHCKRIYAKLGVDNRADLTTRMARRSRDGERSK